MLNTEAAGEGERSQTCSSRIGLIVMEVDLSQQQQEESRTMKHVYSCTSNQTTRETPLPRVKSGNLDNPAPKERERDITPIQP